MGFVYGFLSATGLYSAIFAYVFREQIRFEICLLINGEPPDLE